MSKTEETKIKTEFDKACEDIKTLNNLDNETLLNLYGLYKQALEGDCVLPKPSFFDLKANAKWNSWKERTGMDTNTAMRRYTREVKKCLGN